MSSPPPDDILQVLGATRVLPVVDVGAEQAVAVATALRAGGATAVELTLRRPDALAALEAVAGSVSDLAVGAGTILTPDDARRASSAGARFAVSPGVDEAVDAACRRSDLPWVPGAATASEVQACMRLGRDLIKIFPARHVGGPDGVRSLLAPFAPRGVRAMPTGGIDGASAGAYLEQTVVAYVGGSWMVPAAAIAAGDWSSITARMADAVALG